MSMRQKYRLIAVGAVSALALAACGGNGEGGGEAAPEGGTTGGDPESDIEIALVSKGYQHQFWQAVQAGAEEKAEELGVSVTFEGPQAETEVEAQIQMIQGAIDRQPDAIGVAPLDPEACIPAYEAAQAADIPVVEFDAACDSDIAVNISRTDNNAAGALAADHMAELIGGSGTVGIVGHSQTNSTAVDRRDGFVDQIEAEYPDIEIVDVQYGDGDHLRSADIAKAMLSANPDLSGLYGTNEGSAIGIVNAVNELGVEPGSVTIVGFDSGQAQIEAIKGGVMAGAITQDPKQIGALAVESAYKAIEGEDVEAEIDTGSVWYDATNIEDEDVAALLYE